MCKMWCQKRCHLLNTLCQKWCQNMCQKWCHFYWYGAKSGVILLYDCAKSGAKISWWVPKLVPKVVLKHHFWHHFWHLCVLGCHATKLATKQLSKPRQLLATYCKLDFEWATLTCIVASMHFNWGSLVCLLLGFHLGVEANLWRWGWG